MDKGKWRKAFDLYGYSVATLILVLLIAAGIFVSLSPTNSITTKWLRWPRHLYSGISPLS